MAPLLESDLQLFRSTAERFARKELEPRAIALDNYPFTEFNKAALDAAHEAGLLRVTLPEARGGAGQSVSVLCEILMSLARADASFAAVIFLHEIAIRVLNKSGKQEAIDKYAGLRLIAFPAYHSPFDLPRGVAAQKTSGGYQLGGKVEFLPLAPVADALIIPALLEAKGTIGFFIVAADAKGVSVSDPVISLGLRNCPIADVTLNGVETPESNLLCLDAEAFYLPLVRELIAGTAAMFAGVARGSYETARDYARQRYQGGRMIIDYDMVRMMLAGLAVSAEASRSLVRSIAAEVDAGRPFPAAEAGALLIAEQVSRATADGVQCLGGYGYMEEYGQEKRMRDAQQLQLLFGAEPARRLELLAELIK